MAWKYEELVQEDLNVGTSMVWVTNPGRGELRSTQIGLHTFARGQQEYTTAWTPGAITTTSNASTTITVPDAATGDFVLATHDKILTNSLRISGHVSSTNTVTVVIHNPTTATVTVAAGTLSVLVFPAKTGTARTGTGTVTGTIYGNVEQAGFEISGATVAIAALGLSTTTNASGVYTLTGVAEGSVQVDASASGCQDNSGTGTVDAGQTTTINVILPGL